MSFFIQVSIGGRYVVLFNIMPIMGIVQRNMHRDCPYGKKLKSLTFVAEAVHTVLHLAFGFVVAAFPESFSRQSVGKILLV